MHKCCDGFARRSLVRELVAAKTVTVKRVDSFRLTHCHLALLHFTLNYLQLIDVHPVRHSPRGAEGEVGILACPIKGVSDVLTEGPHYDTQLYTS